MDANSAMYMGINHLHSTLRWVILVLLVLLLIRAFAGRSGKRAFLPEDRKMTLWLTIATHLQLLIGLFQYFVGNWGVKLFDNMSMGEVMKNKMARFFSVEHFVGMLLVVILITIASAFSKKEMADQAKWSRLFNLYVIAFLLILALVPWPFREVGIGRGWFPGM
jgi:cytochrome bd-type quinol oxidase subunit 1